MGVGGAYSESFISQVLTCLGDKDSNGRKEHKDSGWEDRSKST